MRTNSSARPARAPGRRRSSRGSSSTSATIASPLSGGWRRRPASGAANCSASRGSRSTSKRGRFASSSNSSIRGGVSFGPPKSKRSRRTIALDAETAAALREHRETQALERVLAGDAYADGDLVFCDELGRPTRPPRLTEAFLRHRKAAGLSTGTLHVLRHTHATLALASCGVPLHVVAAGLGDRPETVLRTYAHLLPRSDVEAIEQVAALLAR